MSTEACQSVCVTGEFFLRLLRKERREEERPRDSESIARPFSFYSQVKPSKMRICTPRACLLIRVCVYLCSLMIQCVYERVWTELFCQKPCSRGIVWSCGSLLEYRSGFLPRAAERACCQISLARSSAALQGPGQPSCSSHKPFHVPQPQAKSGASLLLQHQRMCLPNS